MAYIIVTLGIMIGARLIITLSNFPEGEIATNTFFHTHMQRERKGTLWALRFHAFTSYPFGYQQVYLSHLCSPKV